MASSAPAGFGAIIGGYDAVRKYKDRVDIYTNIQTAPIFSDRKWYLCIYFLPRSVLAVRCCAEKHSKSQNVPRRPKIEEPFGY